MALHIPQHVQRRRGSSQCQTYFGQHWAAYLSQHYSSFGNHVSKRVIGTALSRRRTAVFQPVSKSGRGRYLERNSVNKVKRSTDTTKRSISMSIPIHHVCRCMLNWLHSILAVPVRANSSQFDCSLQCESLDSDTVIHRSSAIVILQGAVKP